VFINISNHLIDVENQNNYVSDDEQSIITTNNDTIYVKKGIRFSSVKKIYVNNTNKIYILLFHLQGSMIFGNDIEHDAAMYTEHSHMKDSNQTDTDLQVC